MPASGVKRFFSIRIVFELLKSLAKVAIVGFVALSFAGWSYRGRRHPAITATVGAISGAMMATTSVGGRTEYDSNWQVTGLVPTSRQRKVLELAWARGIDLTAHDLVFGRSA